MKIQKSIPFLFIFLYIAIIYFSPAAYVNRPKFLILNVIKSPLRLLNHAFSSLNNIARSRHLAQENSELRRSVGKLNNELIRYKEIAAENVRLKRLLEFKEKSRYKLIPANIISKDSSNLSRSILIDQGASSGIKNDTIVMNEAGLVGRVVEVSAGMSRVLLITNANFRVSAMVLRSRESGVAYGTSAGLCLLKYLPLDADVRAGDEVVTSGFSRIYPKGLFVGRVIKIIKDPRGLSKRALVRPAVDFSKAEELLCIK